MGRLRHGADGIVGWCRDQLLAKVLGRWVEVSGTQDKGLGVGLLDNEGATTLIRNYTKTSGFALFGPARAIDGVTSLPVVTSELYTTWLPESGPILPIEVSFGNATTAVGASGASGATGPTGATATTGASGSSGSAGALLGASSTNGALHFSYPATLSVHAPAHPVKL